MGIDNNRHGPSSITLCDANSDQAQLDERRAAFSRFLPMSPRIMRQVAVPRRPDYSPKNDPESWQRLNNTIAGVGRHMLETNTIESQTHLPYLAFVDWEYPRYSLGPMNADQHTTLSLLTQALRSQGIPASAWGIPFVRERQTAWTTFAGLHHAQQAGAVTDFFLTTMGINQPFYSVPDRLRYIANAAGVVQQLSGWGKPVFVSVQTFVRGPNDSRDDLTRDDAVTIGHALRRVSDAGGYPMIWTEEVSGSYQHQLDAIERVGPWLAEGWNQHDLTIERDAGNPQEID